MKYLFLFFALLLVAMGMATVLTEPGLDSEVPVLYWVTDPNPARYEQVDLFHQWLIDHGHVTDDGQPIMELRLETASADQTKKIVQSVAGVAGDIMDCDVALMQNLGVLEDITEAGLRLGFDPSVTYQAAQPIIQVDGRQYGFPCNIGTMAMWSNLDTFAAVGMEPPPQAWDTETFERIGKEFVAKANAKNPAQRAFFCQSLGGWEGINVIENLLRSEGLSFLNETMTASRLDDPRFIDVLETIYRWTYEESLMPTAAQESSFSSSAGYGGGALGLFQDGRYAMMVRGRWGLIRIRELTDPPKMGVSFIPHTPGGAPSMSVSTREAAVFKGSKHKDLAVLFLAYLASEPYSEQIVRSADALPPLPALAETEEFVRPAEFPNEWGTHEFVSQATLEVGVASPVSPFVPPSYVEREIGITRDHVLTTNRVKTPQRAVADCARAINEEIARGIQKSESKQQHYDRLMELQKKIDRYREEGKPVPLEWITNPFYRQYYVAQGWSVPEGNAADSITNPGGDQ